MCYRYKNLHTDFSFDLITITETWLSDKNDIGMFTLPGYSLEFTNRNFGRGGAVCIYSKSTLNVRKIQELSFCKKGFIESVVVAFIHKNVNIQ